jgi:hypothetical protein
MIEWARMIEVVPEGQVGEAKVTHFEVSKKASDFTSLRAAVNACSGEYVPPGKYARLVVGKHLMMSDTLMEQSTNSHAVYRANGDVLIAGMGLGVMLIPVCRKPEVRSVLVIEKSADVIALVEPHVRAHLGADAAKLTVINMDIFDFYPPKGQKWDVLWFDIWPTVCEDNLDGLATLKRRFCKRLNKENPQCWMGAWRRTGSDTFGRRASGRRRSGRSGIRGGSM